MTTRTEGPRRSMPREPHGNGKTHERRTSPAGRNFPEKKSGTNAVEALAPQRPSSYNGPIRAVLLALTQPRLAFHNSNWGSAARAVCGSSARMSASCCAGSRRSRECGRFAGRGRGDSSRRRVSREEEPPAEGHDAMRHCTIGFPPAAGI
jgi:hypothetical protein